MDKHSPIIEGYFGFLIAGMSAFWNWLGASHDQLTSIGAIIGAVVALHGLWRQIKDIRREKKKRKAVRK